MNLGPFAWIRAAVCRGGFPSPGAEFQGLTPLQQRNGNDQAAQLQGWLGTDHNADGTHKNVRSQSVYASDLVVTPLVVADAQRMMNGVAVNLATATAQTIVTLDEPGFYRVYAIIANSAAGNFSSMATVIFTGTSGRLTPDDGALLTITLVGRDVQITQTSGGNADVAWGYSRVY